MTRISKINLLFLVTLNLVLLNGCTAGSPFSSGVPISTAPEIVPTVTLSVPSKSTANAASSVTYTVLYSLADTVSLTNSDVSLIGTSSGGCSAVVSGTGLITRTVTVTGCTGNGTAGIQINAGTAAAGEELALASSASITFVTDNIGPTLTSLSPATATLTSAPVTVVATFSEAMTALTIAKFVITGTCSTPPTVTGVVMSAGNTVATATLAGGTCSSTENLIVTVTPSAVSDAAGNVGTGAATARTYTVDSVGPTLVSLTPASASLGASPTSIIATFSEAMTSVATNKFAITGTCSTLPTVSGVAMSVGNTVATATLAGGSCVDTQSLVVTVTPSAVTDTVGNAGTGAAAVRTYLVDLTGPTATLAAPSLTLMKNSSTATIALTYTGATATTLVDVNLTQTVVSGTPSCTLSVTGATSAGATLNLASCTGNGVITVHVNASTATDSVGNTSTQSGESSQITIDNTGPTLSLLTPTTATLTAAPTTIVATFNEAMTAVGNSDFAVSGTCATPPTVSGVVMSVGNTVATATLAGAVCNDTQQLVVTVTPTALADTIGNAGTGGAVVRTYTVDSTGPTATLSPPSLTLMKNSSSATIALTYTGATATTLVHADITPTVVSGVSPNCTLTVSGVTSAGATLHLDSCTGNGVLTVHVNANTATDAVANGSPQSAESSQITIDNTGPTLSSLTPTTATLTSAPVTVIATFNEAMTAVGISDFAISGSCATPPTVSGVVMSVGDTVATATLVGAVCNDTEQLVVTVTPTTLTDTIGNAGTSAVAVRTYSVDSTGPSATIAGDASGIGNYDISSDFQFVFAFDEAINPTTASLITVSCGGPDIGIGGAVMQGGNTIVNIMPNEADVNFTGACTADVSQVTDVAGNLYAGAAPTITVVP